MDENNCIGGCCNDERILDSLEAGVMKEFLPN